MTDMVISLEHIGRYSCTSVFGERGLVPGPQQIQNLWVPQSLIRQNGEEQGTQLTLRIHRFPTTY